MQLSSRTHEDADTCSLSGPLKILVVADNAASRMLLKSCIGTLGHTAVTASGGPQALDAYLAEDPDLILMDVAIPGIDGFEAARRIRLLAGERRLPLIFLGAPNQPVAAGLTACDVYLPEPVDLAALAAKIQAALRGALVESQ